MKKAMSPWGLPLKFKYVVAHCGLVYGFIKKPKAIPGGFMTKCGRRLISRPDGPCPTRCVPNTIQGVEQAVLL